MIIKKTEPNRPGLLDYMASGFVCYGSLTSGHVTVS